MSYFIVIIVAILSFIETGTSGIVFAWGQSYVSPTFPDLAPNDECFSNLESVMNPSTKIQGIEVKLVGCLSAANLGLDVSSIPYNLPYDYDYHSYWEATGQYYTSSASRSSSENDITNTPPVGDAFLRNYYNESVIRGYRFLQAVPWVQPYYYPIVPSRIENIVDVADNDQIRHERDSCAIYCNQLYIDQSRSSYTSAAASTETIRFALAYGRCTCLGPLTSSSIQIGQAVNPKCCTPMPSTPLLSAPLSNMPNVEIAFAPQPVVCARETRYAVVYQLSLTCPANGTYCDYKLRDCVSKSVNVNNKKCCLPIGAVSINAAAADSGLVIEGNVMQWLIGAIIVIIITQFAYWVFHARKRARRERLANEENQIEAAFLNGDGAHVLAHRLLIPGDGVSEDGLQEDVIGRMPSWQEVEREMALRNRIAARQELEIVLVPSPNNGLPMSVVIKGRASDEQEAAATEAMRLLAPVPPHYLEDEELCCPICTEELKEEIFGVKTKANHGSHRHMVGKACETVKDEKVSSHSDEILQLDLAEAAVAAQLASSNGRRQLAEGNVVADDIELAEIVPVNRLPTPSLDTSRSPNSSHRSKDTSRLSLDNNNNSAAAAADIVEVDSMSFEETSNVVALACKHLIHRECMHEYMAHVVKSYLAPITCPLCRGIVVLQNLAAEQEVLKRSLLEFRFLVESELLRLVQLGALASPSVVPNPNEPYAARIPSRIILSDGEDAPIRNNNQLMELLRAAQFGFADIPSLPPIAPLPPPMQCAYNDPFAVLAPLQLQTGGHRRDSIPLGPGMRVRPTRRDVVALRVALVSRLRIQLEGSILLSHTRVPGMGSDESQSDYANANLARNDESLVRSTSRELNGMEPRSRGDLVQNTSGTLSNGFQQVRHDAGSSSSPPPRPRSPVLQVPRNMGDDRSSRTDATTRNVSMVSADDGITIAAAEAAIHHRNGRRGSSVVSLVNNSMISNDTTAVAIDSRDTSAEVGEAERGQITPNNDEISRPLAIAPLNLSRGLSRPTRVVRRRGLSVRAPAGRSGSNQRLQPTTTASTTTVQAIVALPARAATAIGSALGLVHSEAASDDNNTNATRPQRIAPSRLITVYESQIEGIEQMGPMSPPREDDYTAAEGDAIGYYEEIRGSPQRSRDESNQGGGMAPASPTAVTANGQRIQRVVAPPPQPRKNSRRRSTSTAGGKKSDSKDIKGCKHQVREAQSAGKATQPPVSQSVRRGSISLDSADGDQSIPSAPVVILPIEGYVPPAPVPPLPLHDVATNRVGRMSTRRELSYDDDL